MALKLKIVPAEESKLKIGSVTTLEGLLDFDGSVGAARTTEVYPDVRGNRTLKWKMYLDEPEDTNTTYLLLLSDASQNSYDIDGFVIQWATPTTFNVICSSTGYLKGGKNFVGQIPENIYNKELTCEFKKETYTPIYFKIDDVSVVVLSNNISISAPEQVFFGNPGTNTKAFSTGTIWDIEVIDDDTSTRVHHWKGCPEGNKDSGWVDLVGGIDCSIKTSGGAIPNLRSVTYASQNTGSALLISP